MTESDQKKPRGETATVSEDESGLRLDRWFKRHHPDLTHGGLEKLLRTGQVRVDGKRAKSADRLESGQVLRLPPQLFGVAGGIAPVEEARRARQAKRLAAMVLYEDSDVYVLNKPPGLAVQGGTGIKESLDDWLMDLADEHGARPKLVHRLDRETSGVLLVARNDFAAAKLAASFRMRETRKIYWALTQGVPRPNEGRIDAPLFRVGEVMRVAETKTERAEAKKASTLYATLDSVHAKAAFVALWPLTGRTHQLRAHLAHIGTPILGDRLYGGIREDGFDGLARGTGLHLHARRLIIPHPRRGMIDVVAPLPPEMVKTWRLFNFEEKAPFDFA